MQKSVLENKKYQVGAIVSAKTLGITKRNGRYIYVACPDCGVPRWRRLSDLKKGVCFKCRGKRVGLANRGRKVTKHQREMTSIKMFGRPLFKWEIVHHKDGNKQNNCIDNLELMNDWKHKELTILTNRILSLEAEVKKLKEEAAK